jgi:hypothetical protein
MTPSIQSAAEWLVDLDDVKIDKTGKPLLKAADKLDAQLTMKF